MFDRGSSLRTSNVSVYDWRIHRRRETARLGLAKLNAQPLLYDTIPEQRAERRRTPAGHLPYDKVGLNYSLLS